MEQQSASERDYGSAEFQELATAVRAYDRLVQQSHAAPVGIDPVELLSALSDVGKASLVVVKHAGAL